MNLSSITTSSITTGLQDLLNLLQSQSVSAGQQWPGGDADAASEAAQAPPAAAPPAPAAQPSGQFAANTLSALISAQQSPPTAADIAAKLIGAADTNGDGSLSLTEIQNAISSNGTSGAQASNASDMSGAFAKLDANGDGVLSADELATGLQSMFAAFKGHHHHHHAAEAALAASTTTTATASTSTGTTAAASTTGTTDPTASATNVTA